MAKSFDIAVFGAGSWGTALAKTLAENGHQVVLWGREVDGIDDIARSYINAQFLPDVELPRSLTISKDTELALTAKLPLIVIPSEGYKPFISQHADALRQRGCLAWATKGLDPSSNSPLHTVAQQVLGSDIKVAAISGPNFAAEVARQVPTATTVAANDPDFAQQIAQALHNEWFRAYTSTDLVGVQFGGALKNSLAIAAGIADGLGFGANTRAALLTRGLAEISRLAVTAGARSETLMGLSGFGDLILTCTDNQSRNRRFGLLLAKGEAVASAQQQIGQVVEGVKTADVAYKLSKLYRVEMPITEQIYRVLHENVSPYEAVQELLNRELKAENHSDV